MMFVSIMNLILGHSDKDDPIHYSIRMSRVYQNTAHQSCGVMSFPTFVISYLDICSAHARKQIAEYAERNVSYPPVVKSYSRP